MARKINRTTNPILYWKPNQFPSARVTEVQWDSNPVGHATEKETESSSDDIPAAEAERIEYLKNRFKQSDSEGPDCLTGPSGCGTC